MPMRSTPCKVNHMTLPLLRWHLPSGVARGVVVLERGGVWRRRRFWRRKPLSLSSSPSVQAGLETNERSGNGSDATAATAVFRICEKGAFSAAIQHIHACMHTCSRSRDKPPRLAAALAYCRLGERRLPLPASLPARFSVGAGFVG